MADVAASLVVQRSQKVYVMLEGVSQSVMVGSLSEVLERLLDKVNAVR